MKRIFIVTLLFLLSSCSFMQSMLSNIISKDQPTISANLRTGGDNALVTKKSKIKNNHGDIDTNQKITIDGVENVFLTENGQMTSIITIITMCLTFLLMYISRFLFRYYKKKKAQRCCSDCKGQ